MYLYEQEGICHRELEAYTAPGRVVGMKVRETDQEVQKSQELPPMTSDACSLKVGSFQELIYSSCHLLPTTTER